MYRWIVAAMVGLLYRRAIAGQDALMMRATAPDVTLNFPGHTRSLQIS